MGKKVKKIILANPRGFCAGVERAISTVKLAVKQYGSPIYVLHEIVHNRHVVKELEDLGVFAKAKEEGGNERAIGAVEARRPARAGASGSSSLSEWMSKAMWPSSVWSGA